MGPTGKRLPDPDLLLLSYTGCFTFMKWFEILKPGKDANEPTIHGPDPVLGWRTLQGTYVIPAYDPAGQEIHVTIVEDGSRRTSDGPPRSGDEP